MEASGARLAGGARDRHARSPGPAQGLAVLADHDRPQADRRDVPLRHLHLVHPRRRDGAGHAPPARPARQHAAQRRDVQQPRLHARRDDDLPLDRPRAGGLRQLLRAVDDRRAGHGLPAAQRALVLAAGGRRRGLLRLAVLRAAAGGLDLIRPAVRRRLLARRRHRRLDLPGPPHRPLVADRRDVRTVTSLPSSAWIRCVSCSGVVPSAAAACTASSCPSLSRSA